MIRNVLRSTPSIASTSLVRPVAARVFARPVLVQTKRAYHEKVIDHYENPRNVSVIALYAVHVSNVLLVT